MKEFLTKYLANLVAVLTIFGLGYLAYDLYQTKELEKEERKKLEERYQKLIGVKDEFERLNGDLSQLASSYKTQAEISEKFSVIFQNLAKEQAERIKLLSETVITVENAISSQLGPDYVYETPGKTQGYILNELRINGPDSPPLGYILIKKDGQTVKKNYKFDIVLESVQLKDDLTGKIRVVSKASIVAQENGLAEKRRPDLKKWRGEKYPLQIVGGEVVIDPSEPINPTVKPRFLPWTLNLNVGVGLFPAARKLDARPTIDLNLAGHGVSKRDLDWKFGHLGVNYSSNGGVGFQIIPVSYRPFASYLTNTYIGPGWFTDGENQGGFFGINTSL